MRLLRCDERRHRTTAPIRRDATSVTARLAAGAILLVHASIGAAQAGPISIPFVFDPPTFALGPEEYVQYGGVDIIVSGYSVPSSFDWNSNGLPDLIVGEGGGGFLGKVRIYPNIGVPGRPAFDSYLYVQSEGADLEVPPEGCLGAFPRVTYWNADGLKDLVIGRADGRVKLYLNIATDEAPAFDGGWFLQVGQPGTKVDIDVGSRATPTVVDWNSDGSKDLVVGAFDGLLRLYLNSGTDTEPDFQSEEFVMASGAPLNVGTLRSSPAVADVTGDGLKDLIAGDTEGRLLLWRNTGTNQSPTFQTAVAVTSDGAPVDLPSTRSRPALCDWDGDRLADVLVGSSDGTVRLYRNLRSIFADGFESGDITFW